MANAFFNFLIRSFVSVFSTYSRALFLGLRERDTMDQRIGSIDDVIAALTGLVDETIDWTEACQRLPAYDGVQAVD